MNIVSAGRYARPTKFTGERRRFNLGEAIAQNDDLMRIVLDKAVEAGHPYTASVFEWAMTCKELRDLARPRIMAGLSAIRAAYESWCTADLLHRRCVVTRLPVEEEDSDAEQTEEQIARRQVLLEKHAAQKQQKSNLQQEATNAKTAMTIEIASWAGEHGASNTSNWIGRMHTLPRRLGRTFAFEIDYPIFAHLVRGLCMACSGAGHRCKLVANSPPSMVGADGQFRTEEPYWQWPLGQYGGTMYAKKKCVEWQVVSCKKDQRPLAYIDFPSARPSSFPQRRLFTGVYARALLHQKDIYDEGSLEALRLLFPQRGDAINIAHGLNSDVMLELFVGPHKYVPEQFQLVHRLGLTNDEIKAAAAERDAIFQMKADEQKARVQRRLLKFRNDASLFLSRHLPGDTLESICKHFPTFSATLDNAILHNDPAFDTRRQGGARVVHPYIDAMSIPAVLDLCKRLVFAITVLGVADISIVGCGEGASACAYEWAAMLTSGSFPGPFEPNTLRVDWPERHRKLTPTPFHWKLTPGIMHYAVCALHLFDSIGTSQWDFGFVMSKQYGPIASNLCHIIHVEDDAKGRPLSWVEDGLCWEMVNRVKKIRFASPVVLMAYEDIIPWHNMVVNAFKNATNLSNCGELHLPRCVPTRRTWDRARAEQRNDMEEVRSYLTEMCTLCALFPETRHAGLFLVNITARGIANMFSSFHNSWSEGHLGDQSPDTVPATSRDFALWFTGNPRGETIRYIKSEVRAPTSWDSATRCVCRGVFNKSADDALPSVRRATEDWPRHDPEESSDSEHDLVDPSDFVWPVFGSDCVGC